MTRHPFTEGGRLLRPAEAGLAIFLTIYNLLLCNRINVVEKWNKIHQIDTSMTTKEPYYVYILTNTYNTVLYTGVTNNLERRLWEHRRRIHPFAFTTKYNIHKLVWFECYQYVEDAIAREKQIKGGSRHKKIALIERNNKTWRDLRPFNP